ncbi:GDP-mannose-dependent alpha-mannosyltransferase [Hoeflea sp. BAL378]|uniref:glycosyltransferase family 4 protein n=1 Tax=Hoeflea sp. BAL378 TaxID=1547437 RepID=UPI0005137CB1|nr:glycosyltransferase family 1 protein [Hoeflea sp. BAL378]KGF70882.1 GDP-mannose-dependent alpha-mannosyltransferase [Hoeflea sp. BAL378]
MPKLLIVTDAWHPQINGVVRSIENLVRELGPLGVEVDILSPAEYRTVPLPGYPEIRLALATPWGVARRIARSNPDFIQIATEGPLGLLARRAALRRNGFTTSYHTRFPEYVSARYPVPESWLYVFMRWFHNAGLGCLVATQSLREELASKGFRNLHIWSRGVDTELFRPDRPAPFDLPRPVFLHVGRMAVEKNVETFLAMDLPGAKLVVGGGPKLEEFRARYPEVTFTGAKSGAELAALYAMGDVFVFPSLTDTFGLVLLEALASGVPIAAYPVTGPRDILGDSGAGVLDSDLRKAALACLDVPRERARARALEFSWQACAVQFMEAIHASYGVAGPGRSR